MAVLTRAVFSAGVGPVFAQSMVKTYGTSILNVLDSPSAASKLTSCHGIGSKFALMIKQHWDESRGTCLLPCLAHYQITSFHLRSCR
jgi:hypothetical protein